MKTTEKRMTRCALYAMCALAVTALTGCSEELSQMFSETTRVEVEARFVPMDDMKTRAADGLDVSGTGFSCVYAAAAGAAASPNSKAKIMIDDGASSYTAYTYRVTGSSALTVEGVAPTFPPAVNEVHVYGWYPYTASSSFTIQSDQQSNVNYCLSDLMLANRANCTRDGNSVTPAALSFRHVMSKVKLVLMPGAGVTITDVALKNVKPTVTIGQSNPASLTVGSASGSAGDVTLLSSGSITSASAAAAKTLVAAIPAQSISGSFITITAEIGGTPSTITYSFDAGSKTFARGKEYTANIAVDATQTGSPTMSLDAWAGSEGTVNIGSGGVVTLSSYTLDLTYGGSNGTITASAGGSSYSATSADPSVATVSVSGSTITVRPVSGGRTQVIVVGTQGGVINSSICTVNVRSMQVNPLWWVAQYNMASNKSSFVSSHSTSSQYVFTFSDAQGETISNYHQPDFSEQISIMPCYNYNTINGIDLWMMSETLASPSEKVERECTVGGASVASSTSIWGKNADMDSYAIRFIGTIYCSAWHYKWVTSPCNGLLIESYLLSDVSSLAEAKTKMATAGFTSGTFKGTLGSGSPNLTPNSSTATTNYFVQRFLPACGSRTSNDGSGGGSGTVGQGNAGVYGCYWSSTADGSSKAFLWEFTTNGSWASCYSSSKSSAYSVRLFRDH